MNKIDKIYKIYQTADDRNKFGFVGKRVKLKDVCQILNGYAFKSEKYVDEGIRVIRITNVQKGYVEDEKPQFYPEDESENIKDYLLKEDDLLISLTGNVGRVALLRKEFLPAALNQRVACLRENAEVIRKKYLYYILLSNKFENECITSAKGIAQKNMSTEWLKEYEIPLVSLEEQDEITEVFDIISQLISNREIQIKDLDNLIRARFVEMFGDPVSNSFDLPEKTLPELGEFGRGVSKHRPRNDARLLGGSYPLIQTGEVASAGLYIDSYSNTYSELGLQQSKMWSKGTLCITIAANIAKTAILNFDACFPDSVVGFKANENNNNVFIHYWFTFFQAILESQAPESAQKNINLKILSELKVIAPEKSRQDEFSDFVTQVDKLKVEVQKSLDEMQILFDSLMQEYFG